MASHGLHAQVCWNPRAQLSVAEGGCDDWIVANLGLLRCVRVLLLCGGCSCIGPCARGGDMCVCTACNIGCYSYTARLFTEASMPGLALISPSTERQSS